MIETILHWFTIGYVIMHQIPLNKYILNFKNEIKV